MAKWSKVFIRKYSHNLMISHLMITLTIDGPLMRTCIPSTLISPSASSSLSSSIQRPISSTHMEWTTQNSQMSLPESFGFGSKWRQRSPLWRVPAVDWGREFEMLGWFKAVQYSVDASCDAIRETRKILGKPDPETHFLFRIPLWQSSVLFNFKGRPLLCLPCHTVCLSIHNSVCEL